jgi:membrane-bound lytic murein transglycosylase A
VFRSPRPPRRPAATAPVPPAAVPPTGGAPAPQALARPLQAADWSDLPGWAADPVEEAWPAFLASCRAVSRQAVWRPVCDAAKAQGRTRGALLCAAFFEARLSPWRVLNADGSREGLVTGYYEPLIKGSRSRSKAYPWPVHGVPDDLLTIDLGDVFPDLKGQRVRGRLVGQQGRALLHPRRRGSPGRALCRQDPAVCRRCGRAVLPPGAGLGRVQLPDGSVVRLAYGDANGHPYQSIGRWLWTRAR